MMNGQKKQENDNNHRRKGKTTKNIVKEKINLKYEELSSLTFDFFY